MLIASIFMLEKGRIKGVIMSVKTLPNINQMNKLVEIEELLIELLETRIEKESRKLICISLYQIKQKKLYRQIGLNTFKEYCKEQRIPISYSTAVEYSIIGNMLLKYEKELAAINFNENDGLKKLLRLSKVLNRMNTQPEDVFRMMKKYSLREFEQYIDSNMLHKKEKVVHRFSSRLPSTIQMDEEVIYFSPDEVEIIWMNMDLENKLGIPHLYKELRSELLNTIKTFFQNHISIN